MESYNINNPYQKNRIMIFKALFSENPSDIRKQTILITQMEEIKYSIKNENLRTRF